MRLFFNERNLSIKAQNEYDSLKNCENSIKIHCSKY